MKLIQGDCLEVMKDIADESIDLVVTDPPYKLIQGGCTNRAVTFHGTANNELKAGTIFKHNDIDFKDWLPIVYDKLKNNTHCYIMCNDRNIKELLIEAEKSRFNLLNILVWGKSRHSPNKWYMKNCEFIVMLRKGKAKKINNMGTKQLILVNNVDKKIHPSEKPVKLMQILIENSSHENELVLDPFMGSGSTGVACKTIDRDFIGIELDEKYFEISKERILGNKSVASV